MNARPERLRPAPAFEGSDQDGNKIRLADQQGKWVVLYFYPKDGTMGCTQEACGFRDASAALRREGAVIIGVSRGSVGTHRDFARQHGLPFPLLADEDGKIAESYGARGLLGAPRRITFLIDPRGRIAKRYRVLRWRKHATKVLEDLKTRKRAQNSAKQT